jgi:hypothetical protein
LPGAVEPVDRRRDLLLGASALPIGETLVCLNSLIQGPTADAETELGLGL